MMSQGSNIELSGVWLGDEEYNKKIEYLAYAYEGVDSELFSSFDILPLRENNLETSSMFFADLCLRLYPLLTIGFNSITFGHPMRDNIKYWTKPKQESTSLDYIKGINIEEITKTILQLRKKNRKSRDNLRDYIEFYRHTE